MFFLREENTRPKTETNNTLQCQTVQTKNSTTKKQYKQKTVQTKNSTNKKQLKCRTK